MRINLNCPYDEKDQAKALGARWDGKTWYIVDVEDLTPFMRWIDRKEPVDVQMLTLSDYLLMEYGGAVKALTFAAAKAFGIPYPPQSGWAKTYANRSIRLDKYPERKSKKKNSGKPRTKKHNHGASVITKSAYVPHCGCYHVLPWEHCEHTERAAQSAMRKMLSIA